jgi:hypothetical protein
VNNAELLVFLQAEIRRLRALDGPCARFAAAQLERAAVLLHFTGAHSEAEFDARIEANEAWVKEEAFERGYAEGRASALRSLNGYAEAHLN